MATYVVSGLIETEISYLMVYVHIMALSWVHLKVFVRWKKSFSQLYRN